MSKKIFQLVVLSALVLFCTNAFAGGSGNPVEPLKATTKHLGVAAAFGYDYMANRLFDLDLPGSSSDDTSVNDLHQVYGKIILGFNETTNIYAKVGGASYDPSFKSNNSKISLELEDGIFAGLGLNKLQPFKNIGSLPIDLGFDIQANMFINNVDTVSREGASGTSVDGTLYGLNGKNSIYLTCKYTIEQLKTRIVPYAGAYHSWIVLGSFDDVSYTSSGTNYTHDLNANYDVLAFGPLVGLDMDIADFLTFNIEGRFVGENSLTAGATIRY